MKPNNPFLVTGYYTPDYFCNRILETETIKDALSNGRNITLIAPRRMGKTGLIKNIFYKLEEENKNIVTIYMDIYSTQNLKEFIALFANSVIGKVDSTPQKTLKNIAKFLKSCRMALTFDEITGVPKFALDIALSNEETTLKEIFDYLNASGKRCYIAIDEFQQIAGYPEKGIEALLRSYIQFSSGINFIFSGSKQHVMQEMFLSAKRPFYQSTQILTLDKIEQSDYYSFANNFFNKAKREFSEQIFNSLYNEFDGHTWYIQAILNRLYGFRDKIDSQLINYAIEMIVNESTYSYENILTAYSSANVKLLKAIAKEKCVTEINSGEFIAKYSLKAASSVNSSLKKLINNELVYKTSNGYIVYDRFMSYWLRQQLF